MYVRVFVRVCARVCVHQDNAAPMTDERIPEHLTIQGHVEHLKEVALGGSGVPRVRHVHVCALVVLEDALRVLDEEALQLDQCRCPVFVALVLHNNPAVRRVKLQTSFMLVETLEACDAKNITCKSLRRSDPCDRFARIRACTSGTLLHEKITQMFSTGLHVGTQAFQSLFFPQRPCASTLIASAPDRRTYGLGIVERT